MKREPLTRGEKGLAGASVAVVAVILGGMLWLQSVDEEPQVDFPEPATTPSPNGFDVYVSVRKSLVMSKPPVDPVSDSQIVSDPKVRAQRYGLGRRDAWLRANGSGFALFKKAAGLPCRHPSLRPGAGNASWPDYASLREVARSKTAEANTFKLRGDWNAAMQSGLDTIQMGIDIPRGGPIIARLVGAACTAIGKSSIEDVVDHLTAAQARDAARRLQALMARRVPYTDSLKQEKWFQLNDFLVATRTEDWRQGSPSGAAPSFVERMRRRALSKKRIAAGIEESVRKGLLDVQAPYSAPLVSEKDDYDYSDPLYRWKGSYGLLRFNQAREKTGQELLLLRLALRAYILDHGAPPANLRQLVPGYIEAEPKDTFADGRPLHYVRRGRSYRLWSVGPDRKDDGGKPIAPREKPIPGMPPSLPSVMDDSTGDWVAGKNR